MQPDAAKFWDKSVENRRVSDNAFDEGCFNASASRYYYAMRQAVHALFKRSGIEGEWIVKGGQRIEHWRHETLIETVAERFGSLLPRITNILETAKELREKGDYEPFPVAGHRIKSLRNRSKEVFGRILNEIE
jgi:uncharacterized protein (UPF0332 family)